MVYAAWLAGLAALFIVLERIWPRFPHQKIVRRNFWSDVFYLVFNGNVLGLILGWVGAYAVLYVDGAENLLGIRSVLHARLVAGASYGMQFVIALMTIDLLHWSVHNLLHRVPFLWEFHRVHHSIVDLDWMGGMRFHWMEAVIYNGATYFLLGLFGFAWPVLFAYGIFSTFMGFFNHANLNWRIGPLKYLFNNPAMHQWHHPHPEAGPTNKNFGINLSVWDWLFGTAYLPSQPASNRPASNRTAPARLGFVGIEAFPTNPLRQIAYPAIRWPTSV